MSDELRIALSVANITEATREAGEDYASQFGSLKPRALADSIVTLAAEVRRLRAAVERVKGLPARVVPQNQLGGVRYYLNRDDVLAALEGRDG